MKNSFISKLFPIYNSLRTCFRLRKQIKGVDNRLEFKNVFSSSSSVIINGNNNLLSIDLGTKVVKLKIKIYGTGNKIIIGKNCRINMTELWIEDDNCQIIIGDYTTIESAHLAATEDGSVIRLGDDCMLAKQVVIRTGDSHSIIDNITNKRINKPKNVTIGHHVWLGERVIILKGCNIQNNSIVATASVVTNDCPESTLIGGIPAKILKSDINWKRERI